MAFVVVNLDVLLKVPVECVTMVSCASHLAAFNLRLYETLDYFVHALTSCEGFSPLISSFDKYFFSIAL